MGEIFEDTSSAMTLNGHFTLSQRQLKSSLALKILIAYSYVITKVIRSEASVRYIVTCTNPFTTDWTAGFYALTQENSYIDEDL